MNLEYVPHLFVSLLLDAEGSGRQLALFVGHQVAASVEGQRLQVEHVATHARAPGRARHLEGGGVIRGKIRSMSYNIEDPKSTHTTTHTYTHRHTDLHTHNTPHTHRQHTQTQIHRHTHSKEDQRLQVEHVATHARAPGRARHL